MNAAVLTLRICIVVFGLIIYPTQLYYLKREQAQQLPLDYKAYILDEGPVVKRERLMVYLYATSSFLWLVYGLVINEWVITFTSTFNVCLLAALIDMKNRLRRQARGRACIHGAYHEVAMVT